MITIDRIHSPTEDGEEHLAFSVGPESFFPTLSVITTQQETMSESEQIVWMGGTLSVSF